MHKHITHHFVFAPLLCLGMAVHTPIASADNELSNSAVAPAAEAIPVAETAPVAEVAPAPDEQVYAKVNGKPVTVIDYKRLLSQIMRERFYHGNAPESQAEAVRKEVGELLIERELLVEEAGRRGIKPDSALVEQAVADADARFADNPRWQKEREKFLSDLKNLVAKQSQLEQIEKAVRDDVPLPADDEVRAYYNQRPELFTEPQKLHLSVILLRVDPSSPQEAWNKTLEDAQTIYRRIQDGADFTEEARLHSNDQSASNGGDLGYVHQGMLPEALESQIASFEVGKVSEPISVLEGAALFRLEDRVEPKLREYQEVAQRAQELLRREQQDQAWRNTIGRLREAANIEILLPITGIGTQQP